MSKIAAAIALMQQPPERYELRADFENGLYSVANANKDSLKLDFLSGKYLAESDPRAGAKTLADILTLSRPDPATYRDASGVLQTAAADEPRIHYPAPRIVGSQVYPAGNFAQESDLSAWGASASGDASIALVGGAARLIHNTTGLAGLGDAGADLPAGKHLLTIRMSIIAGPGTRIRGRIRNAGDSGTLQDLGNIPDGGRTYEVNLDEPGKLSLFTDQAGTYDVTLISALPVSHFDGEESALLLEPNSQNDFTRSDLNATQAGTTAETYRGIRGHEWIQQTTENWQQNQTCHFTAGSMAASFYYQFRGDGGDTHARLFLRGGSSAYADVRLYRTGEVEVLSEHSGMADTAVEWVEDHGDGLFRVSFSFTAPATASVNAPMNINLLPAAGDGTYGIWVGGVQYEVGTATTSLIDTDTSGTSVARTQDSSPTFNAALVSSSLGGGAPASMAVDFTPFGRHLASRVLLAGDSNADANGYAILNTSGTNGGRWRTQFGGFFQSGTVDPYLGVRQRVAASYSLSRVRTATNGGISNETSISNGAPSNVDFIRVLADNAGPRLEGPFLLHSVRVSPGERELTELEQEVSA